MTLETFQFEPTYARRIPDPNFKKSHGSERHIFLMSVAKMPLGLSLDPNARNPNVRKRVYQQVEKSLLELDGSEPGTFHLKNKGITIVANSVEQKGDNIYDVTLKSGVHGIVDGGHTYHLIESNQPRNHLPTDQYVSVEIRTGIPDAWVTDIAGGLNTSVQVQAMSLDHLAGHFDWLKKDLKSELYYSQIAWSENDKGEFDARDIISFMLMFNIEIYPNDKDEHPVEAYEKKSQALTLFEQKGDSFKRMGGILKDILAFHDIVQLEARELWNKQGGKAGGLAFVEGRKRGKFDFHFIGKKGINRLATGALYPMLAAFRWYVEVDQITLQLKWKNSFEEVVEAWRILGADLMRATYNTSNELGRNVQSIGKSRNHWSNLHSRVAKHDLMTAKD